MKFNERQLKIVKFLSAMAPIYQQEYFEGNSFKEVQFKDDYKALILFLDKFAYERNVSVAAYPEIAKLSIGEIYNEGDSWGIPTKNDADQVWSKYKDIAKGVDFKLWDEKTKKYRINEDCNPMNNDKDDGVLSILAKERVPNIAIHVKNLIYGGKIREAYNFIKSVRGVGPKISSMYLRDIAYFSKLEDKISDDDLHLLQPIDTWLEQTLEIIFKSNVPQKPPKQKLIVELCKKAEVSPITFNQGAWVVGSQIAGESERFNKILSDATSDQFTMIEKYIKEKEDDIKRLKIVLTDIKSTK